MNDKPMHNKMFKNLLLGSRWMNYERFWPLKLSFGIGTNLHHSRLKSVNWPNPTFSFFLSLSLSIENLYEICHGVAWIWWNEQNLNNWSVQESQSIISSPNLTPFTLSYLEANLKKICHKIIKILPNMPQIN
jgi:hypothetical protein